MPEQPPSMTQRPIRLGVIGCGSIVLGRHLPILLRTPGCGVAAVVDPDAASLGKAAGRCPDAERFASAEAMIERGEVDAALIATPNHTHAAVAAQCLAAGLHVYIEKPVAIDLAELDTLVEAWHASDRLAVAGMNYRYLPMVQTARQRIVSGGIGDVLAVQSVFSTPGSSLPDWKASRTSGGGALLDYGSHHLDLIGFLADAVPESAQAFERSRTNDGDTAWLHGRLANGARFQSFFATDAADEDRIEVLGSQGQLTLHRVASSAVLHRGKARSGLARRLAAHWSGSAVRQAASRNRMEPSTKASLEAFVRAVQKGSYDSPEQPTLDDGARCLRWLIEARSEAGTLREIDAP